MALALVHFTASGPVGAGATTIAITIPSVTAGSLVVVAMSSRDNPDEMTVSDGTNTYTASSAPAGIQLFQTNNDVQMLYALHAAGGVTTITGTFKAAGSPVSVRDRSIAVWEISGATATLDTSKGLSNQATPNAVSAPVTTTNAIDAVCAAIIYDGQLSGGATGGFTSDSVNTSSGFIGMACSHLFTSSTGSPQTSWTGAANYATITLAFKATAGSVKPASIIISQAVNRASTY